MNQGELIREIINQVRLESNSNNSLLVLSHLEMYHGQDHSTQIGNIMQSILECKKERFRLENELIQKYGGKRNE